MRCRQVAIAAAAALVVAALPAGAGAADEGFGGALHIVLYKALFQDGEPGEIRMNLVLDVEAADGVWAKIYGMALNYNQGDHFGYVEDAVVEKDRLRLKIGMHIGRDNWVSGGPASYTIRLKRDADDRLAGAYEGTWKGHSITGRAVGEIKPPRPIRLKAYKPLDPTEHPRMLLRKHELPALRKKLHSPLGRAYLQKATAAAHCPLTLGMLYQLTGEARYAEQARKVIEGYGEAIDPGPRGAGSGAVGHQFVAVAMAYDLCHDAWPQTFRTHLADRIFNIVLYMQRTLEISYANFNPCSNYYGPGRGAPAIASLALYGDKGPEPKKPVSPEQVVAQGGLRAKLWARTGELDKYRQQYARMLAQWKADHQAWKKAGGADVKKLATFYAGLTHMGRHYRVGIGDGGFQAETGGYADIASWYPLVYAACTLRMFGRDASAYPDITHLMVRRMMQVIFLEGGRMRVQKLNSAAGFRPDWCAVAFPIVPDHYKPGLLWAWNHACGVGDESTAGNIIGDIRGFGLAQAMAFVNYPLDLPGEPPAIKPAHPARCMPLTWQAPTLGFYCFRSGWQGSDDFVAQVFLKAHPVGGWNHPNAGAFTLLGLGHTWAATAESRNGVREQESVVLLPDDKIHQGDCGRLACLRSEKDGSASLTLDLNDLYGARKVVKVRRRRRLQTRPGGIVIDRDLGKANFVERKLRLYDAMGVRTAEHWADSGITGLRAVAFDYSGKSGAPCLMVLVDQINGGSKKLWTWQIPTEGRRGTAPQVQIEANRFTLSYPDATLRATFVSPADVRIEAGAEHIAVGDPRHGFHGTVNRVKATGADPTAGDFFVVITVQREQAPQVRAEGRGLAAKVSVGGQSVRFEAGPPAKIVVGP